MDNINPHFTENPPESKEIPGWEELFKELSSASDDIAMLRQAIALAKSRIDFYGKDQWIGSRETETLLRVSRRTLVTMRKKGTVKSYPQNGKIYYKRNEIMSMAGCS